MQNKMGEKSLIIGITGGIGGGKSTLSEILREKGYFVYDTDSEAKRLQNEHPDIRRQLTAEFGNEIYDETGQLDRKCLASLVFENPKLLSKLNQIIHPVVRQDFSDWQKKYAQEKHLFVESAILFESGFDELTDKIIVVTAPEEVRIKRVAKRDGVTHEQVRARIANQMPEEEKIKRADIVLDSNGKRVLAEQIDIKLEEIINFV
jgi:dephospho-CoA kinase